ncbi:MAG: hypothetical protein PHW82_02330 [Bacteroidales bacterium]|nr:hypothetical protein [Bacteroidales bacterium]
MKKEFRDVEYDSNFESFDSIYAQIPNYSDVSRTISIMHANFDDNILLSYKSVGLYQSTKQTAFALGMYIADLGYVRHFERVQLCMDYLEAVNTLAQKLAVGSKEFNSVVPLIEENLNNRQELFRITDSLLNAGNIMLSSSEKYGISALVLSGLWTESLYLGLISEGNNNSNIIKEAIEKHFLILIEINQLLACLEDDSNISNIKTHLKSIQKKGANSKTLLSDIVQLRDCYKIQ